MRRLTQQQVKEVNGAMAGSYQALRAAAAPVIRLTESWGIQSAAAGVERFRSSTNGNINVVRNRMTVYIR